MGAEFIWLHSASDFSGKRSEYSDRNGICRLSGFSAWTEWGIYFTRGKNWKKLRDFSTGDNNSNSGSTSTGSGKMVATVKWARYL